MPQEHYVLKCFTCETFQAHIVKKCKKWECKLCGAKQSFKKNYFKGSGADCRRQVMRLNKIRLTNKNNNSYQIISVGVEEFDSYETHGEELLNCDKPISKWAAYLEEDDKKNLVLNEQERKSPTKSTELMSESKYVGKNIFESDLSDLDDVLNF